jgi:hypothetical protein
MQNSWPLNSFFQLVIGNKALHELRGFLYKYFPLVAGTPLIYIDFLVQNFNGLIVIIKQFCSCTNVTMP